MAILIAVTSVMLLLVAVLPIYRNASDILSTITKKSAELAVLNEKITILSQLDTNVLQERVATLDKALPPKKDVLLYLSAIDGLSRELGLSFGGLLLSPGEISEATGSAQKTTKVSGGLQRLETEIKMGGGKDSVYAFLRTIEEVLPLMQIKDIKVTVIGSDQYSLALTLSMLWAEPATADVRSKITLFGENEDKYFQQLATYRRFEPSITSSAELSPKEDLFKPFTTTPQP